ncbi:MAG: nitroreductase family protein [Thermoproteus sp. AZ2]|uniref:Nitroreductase family protein n=1 Tax=Thermoproteus sp. AZ2 TaxID=1609232 RepID=A0ACC6V1F1_9CREN
MREELYRAALSKPWVLKAPISLAITAVYEKTDKIYGERRYSIRPHAGHLGQNVYLQATALGLGTVAVGAFYDEAVAAAIGAQPDETPLYMPMGRVAALYNITRGAPVILHGREI